MLKVWFVLSSTSISPKTKFLIFSPRKSVKFILRLKYHKISCPQIDCTCPSIQQVNDIKCLTLFLDSQKHLQIIKKKLLIYIYQNVLYLQISLLFTVIKSNLLCFNKFKTGIWHFRMWWNIPYNTEDIDFITQMFCQIRSKQATTRT